MYIYIYIHIYIYIYVHLELRPRRAPASSGTLAMPRRALAAGLSSYEEPLLLLAVVAIHRFE